MVENLKHWLDTVQLDFVGKRRWFVAISTMLVLASWIAFFAIGPKWGIEFTGGTEIQLRFHDDITITEIRAALRGLGLTDDAVQRVGSDADHEYAIRVQDATFGSEEKISEVKQQLGAAFGPDWIDPDRTRFDAEVGARLVVGYNGEVVTPAQVVDALGGEALVNTGKEERTVVINLPGLASEIEEMLREALPGHSFERLSSDAVGPKVGGDLRRQGFISMFATLGLILVYTAFRFDPIFAPGAVIALFHDVSLVIGAFVLLQLEFSLSFIGALLAIIGYSINDTIVIYDRIRENREKYRRQDLAELINVSVNQTLSRTLGTSGTTILALTAFLVLGGPVIQSFSLAMILGIIFGTYSTVYIASPITILLEDARPWISKFVALAPADLGEREPTNEELLTESEKRRRARAAGDQPKA